MATLTIRKLDDGVYERLRAQAQRNDRSIEAEARHLLGANLAPGDTPSRDDPDRMARLEALMERLDKNRLPAFPGMDSVAVIRAIRDEE